GPMVNVSVRDEDTFHCFTAERMKDCLNMGAAGRPRVYDRDTPAPDDISACTRPCEWTGIAGHDPPDQRRHGLRHPVFELEVLVEVYFCHGEDSDRPRPILTLEEECRQRQKSSA